MGNKLSQSDIERIEDMEYRYQELTRILGTLDIAVGEYNDFKGDLEILKDYMESGQWKKDFEADEAGQIPSDIKREVLSEDGLYGLLEGADRIIEFVRESIN